MTTTDGLRNAIEYALCDEFYEDYTSDGCLGAAEKIIDNIDDIDNINSYFEDKGISIDASIVNSLNEAKAIFRINGNSSNDTFVDIKNDL